MATGFAHQHRQDRSWPELLANFEKLARPVAPRSSGGILLFLACDLDYCCNVVGLPHFNASADGRGRCGLCLANASDLPFTDTAAWKDTLLDNASFLARMRHPLHALAGHALWNKWTYKHDLLHMLDHHGVPSHVVANDLWAHLSGERDTEVIQKGNEHDR